MNVERLAYRFFKRARRSAEGNADLVRTRRYTYSCGEFAVIKVGKAAAGWTFYDKAASYVFVNKNKKLMLSFKSLNFIISVTRQPYLNLVGA
jgi:hypothetical protein